MLWVVYAGNHYALSNKYISEIPFIIEKRLTKFINMKFWASYIEIRLLNFTVETERD